MQRFGVFVAFSTRRFSTVSNYQQVIVKPGAKGSLWVQLNRPELHNAFNPVLISELTDVFTNIPDDTRSVVLTGLGKSFSAGADLNWMQGMVSASKEENKADSMKLFNMFGAIKECPVPVIARVQGAAIAGGTGLVSACDMVFSVSRAKFGLTEAKLGIIPAVISKFVMEKIGVANCRRYFYSAELFDAAEARRIGLVQQVVDTEAELDEAVEHMLCAIGDNSPQAVRQCKQLIETVCGMPDVRSTADYCTNAIATIRVSPEGQEGLASFLEKRPPNWRL
jgi:methylglutaconyl-CoA hydratase